MVKVLGLFLMFVSWIGLERAFDFSLIGPFLVGIFFFFSESIFSHYFFVQREKVRAKYRSRR
jgi:hypothetical protein